MFNSSYNITCSKELHQTIEERYKVIKLQKPEHFIQHCEHLFMKYCTAFVQTGIKHVKKAGVCVLHENTWNTLKMYISHHLQLRKNKHLFTAVCSHHSCAYLCDNRSVTVHISSLLQEVTDMSQQHDVCLGTTVWTSLTGLPWQSATSGCCISHGCIQTTLMSFGRDYLLKSITFYSRDCWCQAHIGQAGCTFIFSSPCNQKIFCLLACFLFVKNHSNLLKVKGQVQVRGPSSTGKSCKGSLQCLSQSEKTEKESGRNRALLVRKEQLLLHKKGKKHMLHSWVYETIDR